MKWKEFLIRKSALMELLYRTLPDVEAWKTTEGVGQWHKCRCRVSNFLPPECKSKSIPAVPACLVRRDLIVMMFYCSTVTARIKQSQTYAFKKTEKIVLLKRASFSLRESKISETKMAEEYCRATTRAVGRSGGG
jgi:hypothetical protein